jgi:hypothetical protein
MNLVFIMENGVDIWALDRKEKDPACVAFPTQNRDQSITCVLSYSSKHDLYEYLAHGI